MSTFVTVLDYRKVAMKHNVEPPVEEPFAWFVDRPDNTVVEMLIGVEAWEVGQMLGGN